MSKILKQRREDINKEIEDVAAATRIKKSFLIAIEEEDFGKLPALVYSKGYIREYADYLKVSPDAALEAYERFLDEKKGPKSKEHAPSSDGNGSCKSEAFSRGNEAAGITSNQTIGNCGLDEKEGIRLPSLKSAGTLWVILVLVIVGTVGVYFMKFREETPAPSLTLPKIETPAPSPVPAGTADNAGVQPSPATQETQPPVVAPQGVQATAKTADKPAYTNAVQPPLGADATLRKKRVLDIVASERTWLQVVLDGSERKDITLNTGDKATFGANETIDVLIGNAAGVKLIYGGKQFDKLGGEGEVVKLSFPSQKVSAVAPAAKKSSGVTIETPESPTNRDELQKTH